MPEAVILSDDELRQITGYVAPLRQLEVLHKRGFVRAYRARDGRVVLERPHYLAVCRGEFSEDAPARTAPSVNVAFLKKAWVNHEPDARKTGRLALPGL